MDASSSNPNMHEQAHWVCPREHMQRASYKLLLAGKENLIAMIRMRLDKNYHVNPEETFKKTAFAVYLRYPNVITKSNKCIHYLISREVVASPDPDSTAIFFRVNDKIVRFGRLEFALVTGLRFGCCKYFDPFGPNELPPNSLYSRLFNNTPISASVLWFWYRDDTNFKHLDLADCMKVSQILIAALTVLGLESNSKIPDFLWVLVENQKAWDKFPWGSISFQILLKALKGVKYNIPSKSYHLNGNTLAFMGWIYEAFPDLGKSIGGRLEKNCRPRGLRYRYDKSDAFERIQINEVRTSLEADNKELNKRYIITLEPLGTLFSFQYDQRSTRGLPRPTGDEGRSVATEEMDAGKEEAEERGRGKRSRDPVEEIVAREMKKAKEELKEEIMGTFAEHVAGLVFDKIKMFNLNQSGHGDAGGSGREERAGGNGAGEEEASGEAIGEASGAGEEEAIGAGEGEGKLSEEGESNEKEEARGEEEEEEMEEAHERERADDPEEEDDFDGGRNAMMEEPIATSTAIVLYHPRSCEIRATEPEAEAEADAEAEVETERTEAEAEAEVSPVTPVFTYRRRTHRKRKPGPSLKSPFLPMDGTDFKKFMRGSADATRNVGLPFGVNKSYFESIKNSTEKLENVHLDVFISILATQPNLAGIQEVAPRTRIMGSSFMLAIQEAWNKSLKTCGGACYTDEENVPVEELKNLSRFVDGLIPAWGGLQSWHDADRVIMVCSFNQHWATCHLDLVNCKLELWDSKQHIFEDIHYEIRTTAFRPVARIVPQVLKYMCFYDKRPGVKPNYTQWPLSYPEKNEIKQLDSESCGPIALKYAVCLLQDIDVKKMTKKDVHAWRNHIAKCIYNFSTDGSTIQL